MNENIRRVEMVLQEVLNVGLGAFNTIQAGAEQIPTRWSALYSRLVSRGALDRSPLADRLHDTLDSSLDGVKDARRKLVGLSGRRLA